MFVIHGTQRFRDRLGNVIISSTGPSTTVLGPWYATVLRWRPAPALFVDESTLLPVLVPFAPARTLLHRFPDALADVLAAHHVPQNMIEAELANMDEAVLVPTANRTVVGVMNEFAFLADAFRDDYGQDLLSLSVRLAATPCGPLYRRHVSPDRELAALIAEIGSQ